MHQVMSLTSTSDCVFRPEEQALKMLFPDASEESNSFDEFFNEDMYKLDTGPNDGIEQEILYDDLFSAEAFSPDKFSLPAFESSPKFEEAPIQPWRKGVWCLKQSQQSAPLTVQKTRRPETKRTGANQTINFLHSPQQTSPSQPYNLPISQTKRHGTSPNPAALHSLNFSHPPFSREATLSPSPMYSQLAGNLDSSTNTWQQDFQNFSLRQFSEEPLQSPGESPFQQRRQPSVPYSTNLGLISRTQDIDLTYSMGYDNFAGDYVPQNVSEAIDPVLLDSIQAGQIQASVGTYTQQTRVQQAHYKQERIGVVQSPLSDSLPSSTSSNHTLGTMSYTSNTSGSGQSQCLFSPTKMPIHPPLPALAPEEAYPALSAPKPTRVPHQILQQQPEDQLRVSATYPGAELMDNSMLYERHVNYCAVPSNNNIIASSVGPSYKPASMNQKAPGSLATYPKLPPPSSYVFPDGSPFTPRKQRRSPSRTPSPPLSPTNLSTRRNPQRSPGRIVTEHGQTRRKSIHKAGPIRDSASQEPMPSPRARSQSRPPRTPRTPKTPAASGGLSIDFVNFTPRDSAKLLNDVAPSGSSKTRARRELEAKEKRKKLSEAALKAVQIAGGDVSAFEKAIFT
ncbi:hypothetical protein PV10_03206 [Exophiala mesophila]|uniref:Uncharacterized protein n=1 Tax=Exophiala mesophila TaxID=212818 RepID=A0A0D1X1F1_EXOME|nr:uncharacterized protein PV10_03206 [Exophiala mesophila]KIV95570.1 hypothetical protein PV10_03206 [Exophiala mesophila]